MKLNIIHEVRWSGSLQAQSGSHDIQKQGELEKPCLGSCFQRTSSPPYSLVAAFLWAMLLEARAEI